MIKLGFTFFFLFLLKNIDSIVNKYGEYDFSEMDNFYWLTLRTVWNWKYFIGSVWISSLE